MSEYGTTDIMVNIGFKGSRGRGFLPEPFKKIEERR
jgi:hypothetical protein